MAREWKLYLLEKMNSRMDHKQDGDGSREYGHTHRWKENGASGDRQK